MRSKKKFISIIIVVLVLIGIFVISFGPLYMAYNMNKVEPHEPYEISAETQALHDTLIIGDWHADSTLWQRDLSSQSIAGHVDIPRMQQGNVAIQMFTTVTKSPSGLNYEKNDADAGDNITNLAYLQRWPSETHNSLTERAVYQARKIQQLAKDNEHFSLILNQQNLATFIAARQSDKKQTAGLIGTEGSHALDGKIDNIQRLYDEGFRMMSLQHFFDNKLGGSLHGLTQAGLTDFGIEAVNKMLELGIIIDVSHSSPSVVEKVLEISTAPLVVSHTGFQGHCQTPRNISDELMQQIAQQGGLIAVGFWDAAVCGTAPADIAAAIKYGIALVGDEHVALGSDFDGAVTTAFDASEMAAITQALLNAGVTENAIRKVMGGNMLRFLQNQLPEA